MPKPHVIDASTAKNAFGTLAKKAKSAPVEITRHGRLESVLISPEMYREFKVSILANQSELGRLQSSFNETVAAMQSRQSASAYDALEVLPAADLPKAATTAHRHMSKKAVGKVRPVLRVVR